MRNLATIQTIKSLDPIEGKDRIVLASFESVGWRVIVGKDMKIGEKVFYFEPDSILPVRPEFEFLRQRCWNEKYQGFRIKRMKMGGILSEGLVIPINSESFPPSLSHKPDGFDVTDILGVVKYDPEALEEAKLADSGKKKYNFVLRALFRIPAFKQWYFAKNSKSWPSFVAKTDETRIQNLQYVFDLLKGKQVYITEKIDGQSATFALKDGVFYVCSRNLCITKERIKSRSRYPQQQSKYLETAKALDIANRLKQYKKNTGHDIYIQGEQMGEGIQGNKYGMPKGSFLFVFNVYDITEKRYFSNFEVKNFCIEYGFTCVPRVYEGEFIWNNMEEILEFSKGNSLLHDIPREGIVIRSAKALPPERGMANQLSFKVINPDFLVKYNLE